MNDHADKPAGHQQLALPYGTPVDHPLWRPVHYLGSKLRLVDAIRRILFQLDPSLGPTCDLFAGSGTVSLGLSRDRSVVAADIQEYSRVLCTALLHPAPLEATAVERLVAQIEEQQASLQDALDPILELERCAIAQAHEAPELLCDLVERGSLLTPAPGSDALSIALKAAQHRISKTDVPLIATQYFGGIYFSYRQSLYIDAVLAAIRRMPLDVRDTCLAALLSTASTLVNSVGKQFAQPMRPRRKDGIIKYHLIPQMCRDRRLNPCTVFAHWLRRYTQLPRIGAHHVVRADYRDVLRQLTGVAAIYADPPYTRDHYSRFYHVLETLCLQDAPCVSNRLPHGGLSPSRGIYRSERHQSPFCIKSQAPGAFVELFRGSRRLDVPLLVSYSPSATEGHPRLMTVEAIVGLANEYYRSVVVAPAHFAAHSKLNKSELHLNAAPTAEVFIMCRP